MDDVPGDSSSDQARDEFLKLYERDLRAGSVRPLISYQQLFPGHEAGIAEEWSWLEPASVDPVENARADSDRARIGPYLLFDELGRGAQATVYLAEHARLRRRVALKVLRAVPGAGGAAAEQRFLREAEVTAKLEHPWICRVYEAGWSDGVAWLAMQFVPGKTLAAHLASRDDGELGGSALCLPARDGSDTTGTSPGSESERGGAFTERDSVMRVVSFVEDAARALQAAHDSGLVHRDIKPGNLMVAEDGHPVVLDFGLARIDSIEGLGLTHSGDMIGTPYYMAPEQLQGGARAVDARVDVYALGVTLFECLTGQRPFHAASRDALFQKILTGEPPAPRSLNPRIPRDLEVVLQTALEKEPGRRYQTARDFAEDLRRVRQLEPILARPISAPGRVWRWARRRPAVAASVSFAVLSLVAGLATSLVFLLEAQRSLAGERRARRSWYDDVSRGVALQDVQGETGLNQGALRRMAGDALEAEVPGFRDRYPSLFRKNVVAFWTVARVQRHVQDIREVRSQLSPAARVALADLVHPETRVILFVMRRTEQPGFAQQVVALAEMVEVDLRHIPPLDPRAIRARVLLLDALNRTRRFADAERQAKEWGAAIEELGRDQHPVAVALFESRRGVALLGLGRHDEARAVLERSVPIVHDRYPGTWYGTVAMANLVTLYDALGTDRDVDSPRRDLGHSVIAADDRSQLQHSSGYVYDAMHRPDQLELWSLVRGFVGASRERKFGQADIDRFASRFGQLRRELGVRDADPLNILHAHSIAIAAQQQAVRFGGRHLATVGRLLKMSFGLYEAGPACHPGRTLLTVRQLGRHFLARGEFAAARDWFRRGLELPSQNASNGFGMLSLLGEALAQLGEFEDAAWRLQRAAQAGIERFQPASTLQERLQRVALLDRLRGDLEGAVETHRRWIAVVGGQGRHGAAGHADLGLTYLEFGRLVEADHELAIALRQHPECLPALVCQAHLRLLEGEPERALALAAGRIQLSGNQRPDPAVLRMVARAHLALGDASKALPHFAAAAERSWAFAGDGFWSDYGMALAAAGRPADARSMLKNRTEERAGDPAVWHARARFLATAPGLLPADRQAAVECARKACALSGRGRAHMLSMLAEAHFAAGDASSARRIGAEVIRRMEGRDARWLSLAQAEARFAGYRG